MIMLNRSSYLLHFCKDKLKCELDRRIKLDNTESITEPTHWLNQLVVVEKPNGKLHVRVDPMDKTSEELKQKCVFGATEIIFLCHNLSKDGNVQN